MDKEEKSRYSGIIQFIDQITAMGRNILDKQAAEATSEPESSGELEVEFYAFDQHGNIVRISSEPTLLPEPENIGLDEGLIDIDCKEWKIL